MSRRAQIQFRLTIEEKSRFRLLCITAGYKPAEVLRRFVEGKVFDGERAEHPAQTIKVFMHDGKT